MERKISVTCRHKSESSNVSLFIILNTENVIMYLLKKKKSHNYIQYTSEMHRLETASDLQ